MAKVEATLLKPLDGDEIGAEREFSKADFDKLKKQGAVVASKEAAKRKRAADKAAADKEAEKVAEKPTNKAAQKPENKASGGA